MHSRPAGASALISPRNTIRKNPKLNKHRSLPGFRVAVLTLLVLGLSLARQANASLTTDESKLLLNISTMDMMSTIERLCSDDFDGRRAGSPQHYKVVDYLVSRFRANGLSTLNASGLDGYRQPLTLRYSLVRCDEEIKATISYARPGKSGSVQRAKTFSYSSYNGKGGLNLHSKIVFVGYGVQDPGTGRDDYKGLDVVGKIVLWIAGQPSGQKLARPSTGAQKMLTAYQHGAVACLAYRPAGISEEFGTNMGLADTIADFPCIAVDRSIASDLLGRDPGKANRGAVGADTRLRVTLVCDPARKTFNVLGIIPGTDPKVANEVVLVGAHFDHLGDDGSGRIFRGADDNASGTSVVLETERAMHLSGLKPRRTIMFASWTGEEGGLIGSNYFTAHPPFPLSEIVSNIELDMVGAGDPHIIRTTGAAAYPDHYRHISDSAADLGIKLDADSIRGASDHLAFVRKSVPSTLFYSGGEHPNYHTVRDVPGALNPKVLESAAKLAALSAWRAANG